MSSFVEQAIAVANDALAPQLLLDNKWHHNEFLQKVQHITARVGHVKKGVVEFRHNVGRKFHLWVHFFVSRFAQHANKVTKGK